jgi:hypothetical protein
MRFGVRIRPEDISTAFTLLIYIEIIATLVLMVIAIKWFVTRQRAKKTDVLKSENSP